MRVIFNKFLPFKEYKAVNLFGIIFARKRTEVSKVLINHETIHIMQKKEMLYIGFYLWYFTEWLINLYYYGLIGIKGTGYKNVLNAASSSIKFEKEAYKNEHDLNYTKNRKDFSWLNY